MPGGLGLVKGVERQQRIAQRLPQRHPRIDVVEEVAQAAGISRRTLFRYYASKNAIPWGDFDTHLAHLRDLLDDVDPRVPLGQALRDALLAF
ncbi:TetR family transcriptional regulator, partial [Mycobacterium malmoense]|uniref:TetR family transcriptional regulator n=1 Tax=Mycobacterium malmoense TaxID=1780 RepID=UPI000AB7EF11